MEVFVLGCFTLFFCCIISSAAGIGGGGLNVPVLLLLFKYSFKESTKLSLCIVLGNALAQSAINISKRHPNDSKYSLIFWELILVLLPAQMGGSNIGTIFSSLFPDLVLYIVAFFVLIFAIVVTTRKGIQQREKETKELSSLSFTKDLFDTISPFAPRSATEIQALPTSEEDIEENRNNETNSLTSRTVKKAFLSHTPPMKLPSNVLTALFLMWIVYTLLVLALTGVKKCSTSFVVLMIFMYIPLTGAMAYAIYYNKLAAAEQRNEDKERSISGSNSLNSMAHDETSGVNDTSSLLSGGDKKNDVFSLENPDLYGTSPNYFDFEHNSYSLALIASAIGVICTLLGVGGGELYGPLMLVYKVMPQVSSATTSMMSLLNTIPSVLRYAVQNEINYTIGLVFFLVGLAGGYIGRHLGLFIANKYKRPSVIIFALVTVLSISAAYYVYEMSTAHFDTELTPYC